MMQRAEILGIKLPEEDKAVLKKLAGENRMTMSAIVRLFIVDGLENIHDRNILRCAEVEA